jgi:hypothetical protein
VSRNRAARIHAAAKQTSAAKRRLSRPARGARLGRPRTEPRVVRGAAALGLVVLLAGLPARADDRARPEEAEEMVVHLRNYFGGELDEAAWWLGVGAGAAYTGSSLAASGRDEGIGASIPLLAIGAIQLGAGIVLLARTDGQIRDLSALARKDLAAYRAEELPRMERVNFWFDVYQAVEISLMVVGFAGIVYGAVDHQDAVMGAGIGLATQATAMLSFDVIAAARADEYSDWIRALTP